MMLSASDVNNSVEYCPYVVGSSLSLRRKSKPQALYWTFHIHNTRIKRHINIQLQNEWTITGTGVRTVLALGYWVLGNIRRYWIVLLLGNTFCCCDTQYDTDQTAVGTVHMITILTSVVRPLLADDRNGGEKVECKLYIGIIIHFWDIMRYSVAYILLQINTLLCYTLVSVLGIGIIG